MSHLARRVRKKRARSSGAAPRRNPPLFMDMVEMALPAGGGFIATRALTKLGMALVEKRLPNASKHVGAGVSVAAFLASWFFGHKVKFLQKYHGPITGGAFLASAINVIQIYVPKLGWFFGDPTKLTAGTPASAAQLAAAARALPDNLEVVDDDPALYTWNDSYDAGRLPQHSNTTPAPTPAKDLVAELMNEQDDMGVFSGGLGGN